jgi:hypothetical protein
MSTLLEVFRYGFESFVQSFAYEITLYLRPALQRLPRLLQEALRSLRPSDPLRQVPRPLLPPVRHIPTLPVCYLFLRSCSWADRYLELGPEGSRDAHIPSILSLTRRRFLHPCRLLPSYLVAAFIKRSMRLALRATPAGISFVMPFAYNLLLKHPQCMPMIHRERSQGRGCEELGVDDCTSVCPAPFFGRFWSSL